MEKNYMTKIVRLRILVSYGSKILKHQIKRKKINFLVWIWIAAIWLQKKDR